MELLCVCVKTPIHYHLITYFANDDNSFIVNYSRITYVKICNLIMDMAG